MEICTAIFREEERDRKHEKGSCDILGIQSESTGLGVGQYIYEKSLVLCVDDHSSRWKPFYYYYYSAR